jgi:hypothetical protein
MAIRPKRVSSFAILEIAVRRADDCLHLFGMNLVVCGRRCPVLGQGLGLLFHEFLFPTVICTALVAPANDGFCKSSFVARGFHTKALHEFLPRAQVFVREKSFAINLLFRDSRREGSRVPGPDRPGSAEMLNHGVDIPEEWVVALDTFHGIGCGCLSVVRPVLYRLNTTRWVSEAVATGEGQRDEGLV